MFFAAMCLAGSDRVFRSQTWQQVLVAVLLIIPSIMGAVASFMYFIKARTEKVFPILIVISSIWGTIKMVISNYQIIRHAGQFVSMNAALGILLKTCIYILIMYQTYTLAQKRKNAMEVSEQ